MKERIFFNDINTQRCERKILRMIFGPVIDTVTGQHRIRSNQEQRDLYNEADIVHLIKAKRLQWIGHVMRSDDKRKYPERNMEWEAVRKETIGTTSTTMEGSGLPGP